MGKTVNIGKRPGKRPSAEAIDKWIEAQGETEAQPPAVVAEPPKVIASKMKRLTIDIPDSLHRRVKSQCGQDGLRMADVIRGLLDARFPESP